MDWSSCGARCLSALPLSYTIRKGTVTGFEPATSLLSGVNRTSFVPTQTEKPVKLSGTVGIRTHDLQGDVNRLPSYRLSAW